jgi:two-component system heavy metal sensor histidine kinase CusS
VRGLAGKAKLSLTQRLTLFFTTVAAVMVLALGYLFLLEAQRHFVELDKTTLQEKRHLIENILRNAASEDGALRRLGESLNFHDDLRVVIRNPQEQIVFQSTVAQGHSPSYSGSAPDESHGFHVLSFAAVPGYADTALQVMVAADTQPHMLFLAKIRTSLIAYAAAAIVVCALLSWLAARQGLAPLREMKSRAAVVTGQKLTERMPVHAVPVEMADLAQELNRMLDRLQQDFQRLTDFAADLAHELRTPISNLLTQTQVTLATKRDAATYRDILASNAEELQRLGRMVSDMLFLAKTERGVDLPHKELFSARQEAQALLDFYEAVAEEKYIQIALEGEGHIDGDRLMFRRAVSNLLSNALRYAPEAGAVVVRIHSGPPATRVAVENTGPDIDAQILPRLFDRFYRADPARAHPGSDGSGLGLAITRAIAQAHGGSITATSSQGQTCFVLSFPCKKS